LGRGIEHFKLNQTTAIPHLSKAARHLKDIPRQTLADKVDVAVHRKGEVVAIGTCVPTNLREVLRYDLISQHRIASKKRVSVGVGISKSNFDVTGVRCVQNFFPCACLVFTVSGRSMVAIAM
jgi:hypothetical protein